MSNFAEETPGRQKPMRIRRPKDIEADGSGRIEADGSDRIEIENSDDIVAEDSDRIRKEA